MGESSRALAHIFEAIANILDIQDANYHRVMAYRRAAESLRALGEPLDQLRREERLQEIPHIGETLAAKIEEYLDTGELAAFKSLQEEVPLGLLDVLAISGMGPRRTKFFWDQLGITSIADLEAAAMTGQLRQVKGIGPRMEQRLLEGIRAWRRQRKGRIPLGVAWPLVQEIAQALREVTGVQRAEPAGSVRRMRETIGDLDVMVSSETPEPVMERFRTLPMVADVLLSGSTKTSIRTMDGIQVDLRVVAPQHWGAAWQYFTGSQAHNVRLRAMAQQRGERLNEYGFYTEAGDETLCPEERDVYAHLGLPWIPPELREDHGEIAAAQSDKLPDLVTRAAIQGDFQCHTTYSDGDHSLEEMARAARDAGLRYLVVADHAQGSQAQVGLSLEDVDAFLYEVARVNRALGDGFRILAGVEVGIQIDGALDWPDSALARMEFVVASIHTDYGLSQHQTADRFLSAIRNPYVDLIGHPTGRLLGRREEADVALETLFRAAAEYGVALEINAWPQRLDLKDIYVRRAIELGCVLAISSDAHDSESFAVLDYGVAVARRGWAEAQHLLNTRPVEDVLAWRQARLAAHGK